MILRRLVWLRRAPRSEVCGDDSAHLEESHEINGKKTGGLAAFSIGCVGWLWAPCPTSAGAVLCEAGSEIGDVEHAACADLCEWHAGRGLEA